MQNQLVNPAPKTTLLLYASVDGQTEKISRFIHDELKVLGRHSTIENISNFKENLEDFDKILLASSIRYGLHHPDFLKFVEEKAPLLNSKKTAFVSVNLVARKIEKQSPETNPYVVKFLQSTSWKPQLTAVFPGKLNYSKYPFKDRIMIQLIMWLTNGPTNAKTNIEYTDWKIVQDFAKKFASL